MPTAKQRPLKVEAAISKSLKAKFLKKVGKRTQQEIIIKLIAAWVK